MKNHFKLKTGHIILIVSIVVAMLLALSKILDTIANPRTSSPDGFTTTLNALFWISIIWLVTYIQNLLFQKLNVTKVEKDVIVPLKEEITKQLIAGRDNRNEKIEALRKELNLEFRLIRLKSRLRTQGIEWNYHEQRQNNKLNFDSVFNEEERLFLERNNFKFTQTYLNLA